jgi:hypothetical protein
MISGISDSTFFAAAVCVGSTATYTGRPFFVVERVMSYRPIATVAT